ncbi:MAG: M28 family peptidase [Bacteroidales bacterium]|nr:M28 family peptidase [Bacteroidales bacterium]
MIVTLVLISCQPRFEKEITVYEIEEHISFLASDELKGRYPGTPEDELLSAYIASQFKQAGLLLHDKKGLQPFDIVTDIESGPSNSFSFLEKGLEPGSDFSPFSFSATGSAEAAVVFAGYGFQIDAPDIQWDDYASLDVSGKWVMLLRGVPGKQDATSPYINYSEDRGKALLAADQGAAGVIFVSGTGFDENDRLVELKGKQHPLSIPVIHLSRSAADDLFTTAGHDSISAYDSRISSDLKPASFASGLEVSITVDLQPMTVETANTVAILKGADPSLRSEYVVMGAHHDHLGMGGPGTSSRQQDTIAVHYGADDNASGVAGIMEISEYMVSRAPSRSMLFVTFGAEEMGLVGSRYFTENSPIDLSMVQAMINIDMVGRLNEDRQLQIGGIGTSPGFKTLIDSLNRSYDFNLKFSNEGYGPSDHAAFYAHDVPVLFISTGAHTDYHTPADHISAINLEGTREVVKFVAEIAEALANEKERIAYTEAGPKVSRSSRGRRGGITLGLMPDMNYDGTEGMPVMFVTEGKPAAVGGIQKGDIIVAIEGKNVGNIYDYMSRLDQLKEGMSIVVTVKRGEDNLDLLVQL